MESTINIRRIVRKLSSVLPLEASSNRKWNFPALKFCTIRRASCAFCTLVVAAVSFCGHVCILMWQMRVLHDLINWKLVMHKPFLPSVSFFTQFIVSAVAFCWLFEKFLRQSRCFSHEKLQRCMWTSWVRTLMTGKRAHVWRVFHRN